MRKTRWLALVGSSTLVLSALAGCGSQAVGVDDSGAVVQTAPRVAWSEHNDTSPPLFLIQPAARPTSFEEHEVKRLPKLPGLPVVGVSAESVLQSARSALSPVAPTLGLNFDGVGVGFGSYADCCAPPDTNGDIGPNHYVQIVNLDYAVFNKTTGAAILGPVPINTLWSGFGGSCQTHNDGDPIVLYDSKADRWVVSQFAVNVSPALQCVAVSTTGDPTGSYFRYAFSYSNFPDYPKMGVWSDAYYETFNMFNNAGTAFLGAQVCAYDRSKMLTGAAATQQCFMTSNLYGGLLPADLDGANAPPAGAPNYVVGLDAPVSSNLLQYWKFHVDWTTPANTTFTGPIALTVASYTNSCNTLARGDCIPQGGGGTNLESLADRAMYRLAYRNFADHQALVFNHTIEVGSGSSLHSGVRWYELRADASNNLSVFQQGTYSPDSNWRWMGSAAQDKAGNMAIGYSVSSSTISPQIHFTGRLAADAVGTLTQGENIVINGGGSQTGGLARWGDYSMMGIDPVDDCTFWYTNEYLKASGSFNWSTRINSFKLPGCGNPDFSLSANPTTVTVIQGNSGTSTITVTPSGGFTGSVALSASGLPAGATASFNPASTTTTSALTLSTATSTPTGSYPITVTGTSGTLTHTTSVTLVVNPAPVPDYSLAASPGSQSVTQGTSASYGVTVTRSGGFTGGVTLSMSSSPAGLSGTFSPNPETGSGSTLSIPTSTSTATGTYTITITGTGSGVPTHTTTVTLTVNAAPMPDFTISATPSSQTVTQGTSGSYTVNVTRTGGFTGGVTLSMSSSPAGLTGTFSPNPNTAASSSLSVPTSTSTATGTYTITITGTGSGVPTHSTTVTLVVNAAPTPDFSLSATPASQTVTQGTSGSYTVNVTRTGGFTGGVTLSMSSSPAGLTGTFSPNPNTGGSSSLTVPTSTSTATGTYTITVTGTGTGVPTHTTTVTLTVNAAAAGDYSLALSPTTATVKAGNSATFTVNITRTGGFAGAVSFTIGGLPAGDTGSFNPASTTGNSSTLTISTRATTTGRTDSFTVTGASGSLTHSASGTLTVNPGCVNGDGDC